MAFRRNECHRHRPIILCELIEEGKEKLRQTEVRVLSHHRRHEHGEIASAEETELGLVDASLLAVGGVVSSYLAEELEEVNRLTKQLHVGNELPKRDGCAATMETS